MFLVVPLTLTIICLGNALSQQQMDRPVLPYSYAEERILLPGLIPGVHLEQPPFEPTHRPPPTLKGSVDYILIPLVLIAVGCPIFVVFYLVLGAFEGQLSPFQVKRSDEPLIGESYYKPLMDGLTSFALLTMEKENCRMYGTCVWKSLSHKAATYAGNTRLIRTLQYWAPQSYRVKMRRLFNPNEEELCYVEKCLEELTSSSS